MFRTRTDSHCIICTGEGTQRKLEEPARTAKWGRAEIRWHFRRVHEHELRRDESHSISFSASQMTENGHLDLTEYLRHVTDWQHWLADGLQVGAGLGENSFGMAVTIERDFLSRTCVIKVIMNRASLKGLSDKYDLSLMLWTAENSYGAAPVTANVNKNINRPQKNIQPGFMHILQSYLTLSLWHLVMTDITTTQAKPFIRRFFLRYAE